MKEQNENILSMMSDGEKRSFNAIQLATSLDSVTLQNDLNLLTDDGLLEQTVVPDDDLYLITAKGLEAAKSVGDQPGIRTHA
jgi:DNA-binding HxlR family transcriptional regulator